MRCVNPNPPFARLQPRLHDRLLIMIATLRGAAFSLFTLLTCFTLAHAASPTSPPQAIRAPQLVIAAPAERPVTLESIKIRVDVTGSIAQTEVEMTFHNPNPRMLEGELEFPPLDGQTIVGFALDVNGKLRDAVPIEKARGQAVFEDIVRGQIDPGLLQQTLGNNFKLRIYPLPPQGRRHVAIRYSESLIARDRQLVYRLPLDYAQTVERFKLEVRVAGSPAAPDVQAAALGTLPFTAQGRYFAAQVERSRFAGRGVLEMHIPRDLAGNVYTTARDGQTWFYADVPVSVLEQPRPRPRIVGIVWDASGSGSSRDLARELELLDAYLRWLGEAEVRLSVVRDAAEPVRRFRVKNGEWSGLRAALDSLAYDGGTALGGFVPEREVEEYLLFSDGLSTFGAQAFPRLSQPLYTISSAVRSDPDWLRDKAHANGGRHIDLVSEDTAAASRKLLFRSTRVAHLRAQGIADLVLASPHPEHGSLVLAGRLTSASGTVRVALEGPTRIDTVNLAIDANAIATDTAAALWARLRIAELSASYAANRADIRRLGETFGIVTRDTSLIVLERIEDYVRHAILPPPELRAEYERLRAATAQNQVRDRRAHLDDILRRYAEKTAWWETRFPLKALAARPNEAPGPQPELSRQPAADAERRAAAPTPNLEARARRAEAAPPAPAARAAEAAGALRADKKQAGASASTVIRLAPWASDSLLARQLRDAPPDRAYASYLAQRAANQRSVAFFLDAADALLAKGMSDLGVRVLSNLAELELENRHILGVLGHRLLQAQRPALAVAAFRRVLELAPDEPQSYRDLGLALHADGKSQEAIDMLNEVAIRPWHGRFPDIELIALADLNAIVAAARRPLDVSRIHQGLLRNLDLDLRVVLTWDADDTDIDLWVTDPAGDKAYYGRQLTTQGGRMSRDFTGGYGPEEFSLRQAPPGRYRVEAQYYGDRRQRLTGPTTLQVKLYTAFGRPEQQERSITLRLSARSETVFVGEFEVAPAGK